MSLRINFGQLNEKISYPNLIENQKKSYEDFLQINVKNNKRKNIGLESVYKEIFPIKSYDGNYILDYNYYRLVFPKMEELDCIKEKLTYALSIYVNFTLTEFNNKKSEEVYMGEIPMMTERGSFIINGAERVVINQLHRSPGICFEKKVDVESKNLYSFRIIPDRGTWLEVQFDQNDLLYVHLDRKRKRRKFLITTLLRALGCKNNLEIINLFYSSKREKIENLLNKESIKNIILIENIIDTERGIVLARAFDPLTKTIIKSFYKSNIKEIMIIDTSFDGGIIIKSLKKDLTKSEEDAIKDIYKRLRPGDPFTISNAKFFIKKLFKEIKYYDLSKVGRYKINQKLGIDINIDQRFITITDLVGAIKYLCQLKKGNGYIDDIDHLGSRCVRTVGELILNQYRLGLSRTERIIKDKMTLYDQSIDSITPQKLVNYKILSSILRDFFSRSQLSQFMDQINPLSEITHKRRLSALGPGGLNRDRAKFEVRDVHTSHYGRICPIETPEGPNIGLINSLSLYSKINRFGFIETPYRLIEKNKKTKKIKYLTADLEEKIYIAQSSSEINKLGKLKGLVTVRQNDNILEINREKVNYMDISPKQIFSVAAGLIPFLEHNDANRALMGSNMQRQGVPLLYPESPLIGTGIEKIVALDSGNVIVAESNGIVAFVDATKVIITKNGKISESQLKYNISNIKEGVYVYPLKKFMRSNAATCFNQNPCVLIKDKVKKGDILADGAAINKGELALGKNVLVAFMPWNGYNFEDAILISEKLLKEDIFSSIHIEEFEVMARDTKLGAEEITRDIPNLSEDLLKNLGRDGIIRIGAEVKPGDILVGKITPKNEIELAPEEKLLRAIFGEKAADIRDTSLTVPSGINGIVMDVKIFSRNDKEEEAPFDKKRQIKRITEDFKVQVEKIREELTESLSNILLGEKIPLDVKNSKTNEIIIPANRKITKTLLRKLASVYKYLKIDPSPVRIKIMEIIDGYEKKFLELEKDEESQVKSIKSGEILDPRDIKSVKIYIANKRKIQVGDKMAGRHGNKGVVAKIVREEDMPFLKNGIGVDIILNPLGVPSRMNVGQMLETHMGWACKELGIKISTPIFDGISEKQIRQYLKDAGLPESGKTSLYDGQTGEKFDQEIVVGYIYMMKLNHLVADKIHARSVGPYSLITQQPLGGKAQYGGQRFGEMEVWALEAYGAAYTLQELLTVKSDDVQGRTKIYESLVKGNNSLVAGIPQSFNVLMKEMQSLCLDIRLNKEKEISSNF